MAIVGADGTCSDQCMSLAPFDAGFLDRAHRFLRLWAATGYKMWELDLLLRAPAVGNGTLDEGALAALLAFQQVLDATKLDIDQQLAFYQDIDTGTHRDPDGTTTTSLYAQIFLNPTVTSVAPDPDMAAVATGGTIADAYLSDHVAAIQPALGVSAADGATLFGLTDNQLTLDNLSFIYRVSLLATAAKLSIADLIALAELLDPTAASPGYAVGSLCGLASGHARVPLPGDDGEARRADARRDHLRSHPAEYHDANGRYRSHRHHDRGRPARRVPFANFYVSIGAEILLVTAVSGTTLDGRPAASRAPSPQPQAGARVALSGAWPTTTQMTQADIGTALGTVRQAVASLLSASTTLAAPMAATDTVDHRDERHRVSAPNFSVAIGAEILLVTAVGGSGNTTWTVARGQQGTTAAAATSRDGRHPYRWRPSTGSR